MRGELTGDRTQYNNKQQLATAHKVHVYTTCRIKYNMSQQIQQVATLLVKRPLNSFAPSLKYTHMHTHINRCTYRENLHVSLSTEPMLSLPFYRVSTNNMIIYSPT